MLKNQHGEKFCRSQRKNLLLEGDYQRILILKI